MTEPSTFAPLISPLTVLILAAAHALRTVTIVKDDRGLRIRRQRTIASEYYRKQEIMFQREIADLKAEIGKIRERVDG